jgi:hypothetical protein
MMCADAGLHADQARWQVCKSGLELAARPFLSKHNRTTLILSHNVERVLANIDADHGDCATRFLRRAPCLHCPEPASITGGAGARPDLPISGPSEWQAVTSGIAEPGLATQRAPEGSGFIKTATKGRW